MRSARRLRFALFAVTVLAHTFSAEGATSRTGQVGDYRLGMTNAEAAKVGLSDCKDDGTFSIVCRGTFKNASGTLSFNRKTKRLETITAGARHKRQELDELMTDLKLEPCPEHLQSDSPEISHYTCHLAAGPRRVWWSVPVRSRLGREGWIVEFHLRPGEDRRFVNARSQQQRKASNLEAFQRGK